MACSLAIDNPHTGFPSTLRGGRANPTIGEGNFLYPKNCGPLRAIVEITERSVSRGVFMSMAQGKIPASGFPP